MTCTPRWTALVVAAGLLASPAAAGESDPEPLETDRPDITETSSVVGQGAFQFETSIQREYLARGRQEERSWFTPTLFRWGFHDRWEARLETAGYSRTRSFSPRAGVDRTSGYSPLSFGVKYHFQDEQGASRPSLGSIFHVQVPTGSSQFQTEKVTGDLKLAADWKLGPRWALGVNLGVGIAEDDSGEVFPLGLVTAALNYSFTDRLRTYAELAVQGAETRIGGVGVIFDGGFAYLLNVDTQLDFAIGTGLAGRTTPDLFWGIGFSRRFR